MVTFFVSCSDSDPDDPEPVVNYTIEYTVVSTGDVTVDTIKYINVDGEFVYVLGETQFNHSFTQPSNNYHAEFYISGAIGDSGNCSFAVKVIEPDSSYADIDSDEASNKHQTFKWSTKFQHTSN